MPENRSPGRPWPGSSSSPPFLPAAVPTGCRGFPHPTSRA